MSLLPSRTSLFDDLFRDMASGFYIRPLHGDPLPSQIRLAINSCPQSTFVPFAK